MSVLSIATTCLAYLLAALFISSGLSKFVVPKYAVAAVSQLTLPRMVKSAHVIQLFAMAEVVVGLGLALPPLRSAAASVLSLLGVFFFVLGCLALRQHVTIGCGCFGRSDEPALGVRTIVTGLMVTSGALMVAVADPRWLDTVPEAIAAVALTVLLVVAVVHRRMVVDLVPRPLPSNQRFRSTK